MKKPIRQPADPQEGLQIRLPLGHDLGALERAVARACGGRGRESVAFQIVKRSIDARQKGDIQIQYQVRIGPSMPPPGGVNAYLTSRSGFAVGLACEPSPRRPIVVGCGPAGLFAARLLALAGRRPIVLERGQRIAARKAAVDKFWLDGSLDPENNVQFGEGGAGTFSDGKLTTNIKDPRCRAVLEEMVLAGAPESILIDQRPHVGTDLLSGVVTRIRESIEALGGEFRFGCRLDDFIGAVSDHGEFQLSAVLVSSIAPDGSPQAETLPADDVILATGHSARDVFETLEKRGFSLAPKPFSIGVRIEHAQVTIDQSQYGPQAGHPDLPAAEYKLAVHLPSGRSVYTFCMCPGGQVVASASEQGGVVTNGMSLHARDQANANSALLVEVTPADYPVPGPLGGIALQRQIEKAAFVAGGSTYRAPAQRVGDFLAGRPSDGPGRVLPSYTPGVTWTALESCLPQFALESLRQALPLMDRKLKGFAVDDAVLTGVETRSSSPVRILRSEACQSSWLGVYPCGEGAGYAGGIMSAAVDGLRCAEALLAASPVL